MKVFISLVALCILNMTHYANAETVMLKDGQVYEGTIIEEYPTFIKIKTNYGPVLVEREQIMSLHKDMPLLDEKTQENSEKSGDGDNQSFAEYKAQIRYLTEQLKVYKSEISLLEEELNEIESKYTKKQTALEDRIKELEAELKTKEQQLVVNKFPGLIPIIASEEIDVNQGYIKKAKFRINKSFEGYFIGAEYEVYSEFVPIKPKFTVFFFNADGLNIGTDTVDWEFTHVLRGQTEVIVKGIPMAIPNSEPKYFFIKILSDN